MTDVCLAPGAENTIAHETLEHGDAPLVIVEVTDDDVNEATAQDVTSAGLREIRDTADDGERICQDCEAFLRINWRSPDATSGGARSESEDWRTRVWNLPLEQKHGTMQRYETGDDIETLLMALEAVCFRQQNMLKN